MVAEGTVSNDTEEVNLMQTLDPVNLKKVLEGPELIQDSDERTNALIEEYEAHIQNSLTNRVEDVSECAAFNTSKTGETKTFRIELGPTV